MSSRRCGLCSKRPRRRLQKWSDSCVNRVHIQSASRFTRRGRETMASVGMSALAAAIVNNAPGINGRRLASVESSSKEDEAQSQKKISLSSKDTEPTQRDFQEKRKPRRSQSVLARCRSARRCQKHSRLHVRAPERRSCEDRIRSARPRLPCAYRKAVSIGRVATR